MIETQGVVTAIEGDFALVEVKNSGCGRCHETGGCGGNSTSQLFCSAPRRFRVINQVGAQLGETVAITVADGAITRSVTILYLLPLSLLILGAILGGVVAGEGQRDRFALVGTLIGGAAAWWLVARLLQRSAQRTDFQPKILTRIST